MKGTIEFNLKNGGVLKIEAEYECVMKKEIIDADGDKVMVKEKPTDIKSSMIAYVNGKKVDSSDLCSFWRLIDTKNGSRKIWGMGIAFTKQEDAERYEKWVAEIIESGKSDEVKDYEEKQIEKKVEEELNYAKRIIEKAEKQINIPNQEEAERRMKQYNDIANEGGEGYVPHIISMEEYMYAKGVIEKYGN